MFKELTSLLLICLVLTVFGTGPAYADTKEDQQARFIEKVKQGISKLGIGTEARIEVKLRDKTKLKGYVSHADADSFVVVDANGAATTVSYPQVKQVKGNNLSEGVKIAIGIGALVLLSVILLS